MPILTCAVPAFPLALQARHEPNMLTRPLALLGPDERVVAATPSALAVGVQIGQPARQARAQCADLQVHDVDAAQCQTEFNALLDVLDQYSSRVEAASLGRAWVDVPDLTEPTALAFCQDLGRRVRAELGDSLQPAIGCDSGKFTAHAAADQTRPGAVRIVLGRAERPFLRPLPLRLLPLPAETHLRLGYLGLRTLGQYADLPTRAVLQQFGAAGQLAQRWARGQDDRPVMPRRQRPSLTVTTEFDPPLDALPPLLLRAIQLLDAPLTQLRDRLQTAHTLTATWTWTTGGQARERWALVTPTAERRRLAQLLRQRWERGGWEGAVSSLTLTLDLQDEPGGQLALWPSPAKPHDLTALAHLLRRRYGSGRLWQASVSQPQALRVERRATWRDVA